MSNSTLRPKRIAILGWGSLIWSPRGLSMTGHWQPGPSLPIEFARKSADGRLTLVLYGDHLVPTFWARSGYDNLQDACENLRQREGNARAGDIHFSTGQELGGGGGQDPSPSALDVSHLVGAWLASMPGVDAALWTGLPPRGFVQRDPSAFTEAVLTYLVGLTGETAARAEEYVRRAPAAVRTPIRTAMEGEPLRWLPHPPSQKTQAPAI